MQRRFFFAMTTILAVMGAAPRAQANEPIAPALQKTVDEYKTKLTQWAANPTVVSAIKASNAAGGLAGMTPAKWTQLADTDPVIKDLLSSPAGKLVDSLDSKTVNKVVLRDKLGNLVAANTKVALYNVAHRPVFKTAITGAAWQQENVQVDVTTQLQSVQIAVPVKDGGSVIGVMHASISAN